LNETHARLQQVHDLQLEQAHRLATTGEMAASIAHEIKNPVAGIIGALQVLESENVFSDSHRDIIAEMQIQLERVNQAVNDLLSYARPAPPMFGKVDLHELIKKTAAMLSHQMVEKNIEVSLNLAGSSPEIRADGKQLRQLLWNIILNAMQAVPSGGKVAINTSRGNTVFTVQISDNGKGMPEEVLAHIYEPFFTTKHKGTGLGMTISKRIIEQHKGGIEVESRIDRGTAVTITLPQIQDI